MVRLNEELLSRLSTLRKELDISTQDIIEITGVSQQMVSNYLSGRNTMPLSFIIELLNRYPDLSAEWLLRGEGEMLKGSVPQTALVDLESEYNRGFHDGVCSVTGFRSQKNASGV